MENVRVPVVLFSQLNASGSVYNSPKFNLTNAKNVRLFVEGPKAVGANSSVTIWFKHAATENGTYANYTRVLRLGDTGGTLSNYGNIHTVNFSSDSAGTCVAMFFDNNFVPFWFQALTEMSAPTASASCGTLSVFMLYDPVNGISL